MKVWRGFDVPEAGYVNLLSEAIVRVEENVGDLLWPVDTGRQIIVSDYSGQHRGAANEVYSFLITTSEILEEWLPLQSVFRGRWLPDNRRISFKQLREPMRRRAYPYFLELVGKLRANLVTVMIDNRVESLVDGGPKALAIALDDCFASNTPPGTVEKIYRLAVFLSMIGAGLRRHDQCSLWISDHDETLDTFDKRERICRLMTYLYFGFTGRRKSAEQNFVTTAANKLPNWVEDVAAIPEIAAGACANLYATLPLFIGQQTWTIGMARSCDLDWRAAAFCDWLTSPRGVLRHVLLRLAPDAQGEIRASAQKFVRRTTDYAPPETW